MPVVQAEDMNNLKSIAEKMRQDWDRRVSHDYRFWMSDGHESDEAMWASGERDLECLLQDLSLPSSIRVLELGCGVGRILRAASQQFSEVIGIDVSEAAVSKARGLLSDRPNVQVELGTGVDLAEIPDSSIDLVISFAALTSMPTDVVAMYLTEIHRVLKPGGMVRLQIYLGRPQDVPRSDTLHLRCYDKDRFQEAVLSSGFDIDWIRELTLPFQVSFKEIGIEAEIVSLRKAPVIPRSFAEVSEILLPEGEREGTSISSTDDLEYWMSVRYAEELADRGEVSAAKEALDYALQFSKATQIDIEDLLGRVVQKVEKLSENAERDPNFTHADHLQANLEVIQRRFPEVASVLSSCSTSHVEVRESGEGEVLFVNNMCLDHKDKPLRSAENWVKRVLCDDRIQEAEHLVCFGFGAGYHIRELLKQSPKRLSVIEPDAGVLKVVLSVQSFVDVLEKLDGLSIGADGNGNALRGDTELLTRPQTQAVAAEDLRKIQSQIYGKRGLEKLHPQIGVVGPLQGGTLPIMGYTVHSLLLEQQRVRDLDMSGFAAGYHATTKLVGGDVLKAKVTGSYTEMLSELILDSVTERPVDILICMAQAPLTGNTLTELRKRGIITVLWFVEDYTRFRTWKVLAPYYDYIFTIQTGECIEAIKAAGCSEVHYLPTAADPYIHRPFLLEPDEQKRWGSDVSFVGAGYHNRQQTFASLANYNFKIWGTEWPDSKPFDRLVQEGGRRLKPDEYVKIFNSSKINLNLHSSTERDGVDPYGDFLNPRTFELAAAEAFQLVDERSLFKGIFTPGEDIVTFRNTKELKDKIDYYLAHPEERAEMARRSRKTVLEHHTYQHRLREMLSIIYSNRYEQLRRREEASPWQRVLERAKGHPELHERCKTAYQRGEEAGLDALVSDIVTGEGSLTETEQKLLLLFHVSKQIINMRREEIEEQSR